MGMTSKKIYTEYYFISGTYTPWFWGEVTVNSGLEVADSRNGGIFSTDFTDNQILLDFFDIGAFTIYTANSFRFADSYDTLNPIVGVQLRTNMNNLSRSDIHWNPE